MSDVPPAQSFVQPVSELVAEPLSWLWPGRLALGKLALLEGDPGLGKSLLALDLCARLSTGQPFPDGAPTCGPANSIVLNAEDGAADTIRPRLEALGADLRRVFAIHRRDAGPNDLLRLPGQIGVLADALAEADARLVVVDPLVAFLDARTNIYNDQSVRHALHPLVKLAAERRLVFLLIRHLNKTGEIHSLYRGGGSIAFQAACRSSWLAARDPGDPKRCILAQVKNNLASCQPSLVFRLDERSPGPPGLAWLGESNQTATQLLAGAVQRPPVCLRDFASEFLSEFLGDGPRTVREIWKAAKEQGLCSESTLDRARQNLEIRSVRVHIDNKQVNYWLLPGQDPCSQAWK
jgi:hypothetical protein